jgi:hypothetical protein
VPEFPSWRVMTLAPPTDKWDVHFIAQDEDRARERAGHLTFKGLQVRLQHRHGKDDDWEDVEFVEKAST